MIWGYMSTERSHGNGGKRREGTILIPNHRFLILDNNVKTLSLTHFPIPLRNSSNHFSTNLISVSLTVLSAFLAYNSTLA